MLNHFITDHHSSHVTRAFQPSNLESAIDFLENPKEPRWFMREAPIHTGSNIVSLSGRKTLRRTKHKR